MVGNRTWDYWVLLLVVAFLVLALTYTNFWYSERLNDCVAGQLDDFVSVKCPVFNEYEFNQTKDLPPNANMEDWEWCGDHWCYLNN